MKTKKGHSVIASYDLRYILQAANCPINIILILQTKLVQPILH